MKPWPRHAAWSVLVLSLAQACNCDPPLVTDARVRSCEALVEVDGAEVPRVEFGDAVRGAAIPRAPQLAITFAARADAPLTAAPFAFRFRGAPQPVRLVSSRCFDAAGAVVDGEPLRLP